MIICLVFLDQIVKFSVIKNIYNSGLTIIDGILDLTYVENTGGAFGIGNNSTIIFVIINIIVLTLLTVFIMLKNNEISILELTGLALILSGGIGNLIDRLVRGFVIDYIDVSPLIRYPVFNIADICIIFGCIIVGTNLIINIIKEKNNFRLFHIP